MKKGRGKNPLINLLVSLAKIAFPLVLITMAAVFVLTYDRTPTGTVRVTTSVPGADIYIAGVQTGMISDTVMAGVPTGRQLITVRKRGYISEPEVAIVEVYPDRPAVASFLLREVDKVARIDSVAPGRPIRQEIFSSGEPVKQIPPAPSGPGLVSYEDDYVIDDYSYEPPRTSHTPPAQTSTTSKQPVVSNQPAEQAAQRRSLTGTQINVTSNPAGATIIVNSAPTPHSTPYTFQGLDRGVYVFELQKEGYAVKPEQIPVTLSRSDQSELVAFNLTPDDSWPRPIVRLSTEPLAAGILLDGVPVGVGQADVEVEFGTHKVTFADAAGYQKPAPITFTVTPDSDAPEELTGTYERVSGNAFLAVVPGSSVNPFDGTKLRIYVDNELILDGHDEPFDLTLVGSLLPGNRLIRVEYGEFSSDIHVDLSDGDVAEVQFRVESFFSKRSLKLKERREIPLDKWQARYRNSNILSLS